MPVILVDTGPLVAAVNRRDQHHEACRTLLDAHVGDLLVTPYVIAEVCWMVSSRIGATAEANVIAAVAAGELHQVTFEDSDLHRIAELLHRYADLHGGQGLSAADASVVAVAERLGISDIATLDVTDFSVVRPQHIPHFTLLP
jgi:predicted nucleic acid-binding protein